MRRNPVQYPATRRFFGIITDMEKIATDICSFENLRKSGYVYVDKTDRKGAL